MYTLVGVSNHMGSLGGGHYTAYVHRGGEAASPYPTALHWHPVWRLAPLCVCHLDPLCGAVVRDCRNADDNKWYNFNDSRVSPTSAGSLDESTAYLLFYQRVA